MELVDEVLLGGPCACLSHGMASIGGGDEGIVGVGGRMVGPGMFRFKVYWMT